MHASRTWPNRHYGRRNLCQQTLKLWFFEALMKEFRACGAIFLRELWFIITLQERTPLWARIFNFPYAHCKLLALILVKILIFANYLRNLGWKSNFCFKIHETLLAKGPGLETWFRPRILTLRGWLCHLLTAKRRCYELSKEKETQRQA